jgi:hypothetical protein
VKDVCELVFKKKRQQRNDDLLIFLDVGMGIAVGAGALLVGGKIIKFSFFFVFINITVGGGLLILGGKK